MTSRSKYIASLKQLQSLEVPPAVVMLLSPDRIRRERAASVLLASFQNTAGTNSNDYQNLRRINASDLTLAELAKLFDEGINLSLFASHEYILIFNAENLSTEAAKQVALRMEVPHHTTTLILSASKFTRTTALFKKLSKGGLVVDMGELKGPDLRQWAKKELLRSGFTKFSRPCLETLIESASSSPDQIAHNIELLSLYLDRQELREEDIHKLFVYQENPQQYKLIDALNNSNQIEAQLLLLSILRSGTHPFALLSNISRDLLKLLELKYLLKQGVSTQELKQLFPAAPWLFTKQLASARKFKVGSLTDIPSAVLTADRKLKLSNKTLGPDCVLEECIDHLSP